MSISYRLNSVIWGGYDIEVYISQPGLIIKSYPEQSIFQLLNVITGLG